MVDISFPFGDSDGPAFDDIGEFVPENIPEPDAFLSGHEVLIGDAHVDFHTLTRELFEERGVYDMTFDYNLARLNLDPRHPNAGYRYAEDAAEPEILRAEFTPTTPFCPQTHTLMLGSFRAWNGLADRHNYDLVRVRSHPMHHKSEAINAKLSEIETTYRETGAMPAPAETADNGGEIDTPSMEGGTEIGEPTESPDAPF
ncbi:hypothetical protein [Halonotius roseus]|uniref:DUF7998 domain-containing protein n=1 Tax=Halonotius roseus TaxID=2511997 RepID=A0A544QMF0_9EURY|nr:hypothetical protein [Halonotius roseus]TQQ80091.1 hypothetical protein EWF95_06240 [Halonotius roseus]